MNAEFDPHVYLRQVYAAWLGKIIGVRLGSPVEGWSAEKIREVYPDKEGYLVDYDVYAADDDLNGPLFFVRSLLDYDEISAENIGDTFLNYLQEYHGFFWWGGVGVSSEHTAYENLKNGIKAPQSGSMLINGKDIAEQIGGQIFSDCWGYVAGYDPKLAARLAGMAASVTHDGCGIQGGIFVAVAITLAFQKDDIHEVLNEALTYLDKDQEYYQVAKDILNFYEEHPDDQEACLHYIQGNYGYDRYPGVCHIIPNMALMIMAMSYGDNDFDKTLIMLNRSGWDTDCNLGNVGSIMGALLGLEGIRESWITPLDDIVNASSAIGCLNIQTISDSAAMYAALACRLKGLMEVTYDQFELPYARKGFRCREGKITVHEGVMEVDARDISRCIYYRAEDLYDARYEPEFSPLLNMGDEIRIKVSTDKAQDLVIYLLDCEGNEYRNQLRVDEEGILKISVPVQKNLVVNKLGILSQGVYRISDIAITRADQSTYDFLSLPLDHYGPLYGGGYMNNIRAFVTHSGHWQIWDGLLGTGEYGLISSGNYDSTYDMISWRFVPIKGRRHFLVINMRGCLHYDMIGLDGDQLVLIHRDGHERTLGIEDLNWVSGQEYEMVVQCINEDISVKIDGQEAVFRNMSLHDLYGFSFRNDGELLVKDIKIKKRGNEDE